MTGAGIVLPKLPENDRFYSGNRENRAEIKFGQIKKSHSEIKWRIGETKSPLLKTQNPNSIPIRGVLSEVTFNSVHNQTAFLVWIMI